MEVTVSGVRIVQPRRGRGVMVIDRHARAKAAILKCLLSGMSPRQTARALRIPLATVIALGLAAIGKKSRFV